jgi:uncharacterized peroxidase-related enzyme
MSMIVATPDPATAEGIVAEKYREDLESDGFVFGHTRAMAVNPEAEQAFEALVGAVVPSIGLRTYELATLGAAAALKSGHCLLAHGRRSLRTEALDEDEVVQIARGDDDGPLAPGDAAVVRFAAKVSTDAAAMTDADSQDLRDHGYSDHQIVDIALAAAARNYFSRALLALAVPLDDVPGLSPRVKEALLSPLSR